jgi:hypothetical protein
MKKPLLEILIGTYKRPDFAIKAVNSCLSIEDDRLNVFCHSNGYDEKLNYLNSLGSRVRYGYFEKNMGVWKNYGKLLSETRGKYCMILSDEDRINTRDIIMFLDWLEKDCDPDIAVINCSIYDEDKKKYYYRPSNNLTNFGLSYVLYCEAWQHTVISGFVYRVSFLESIDIEHDLRKSLGNVYCHINLATSLLKSAKHAVYRNPVVIKGKGATTGGEAYEHIKQTDGDMRHKYGVNPKIYSAYARGRQFFYMQRKIHSLYPNRRVALFFYDLRNVIYFYNCIVRSNRVTGRSVVV